jgi:hypothetical protein
LGIAVLLAVAATVVIVFFGLNPNATAAMVFTVIFLVVLGAWFVFVLVQRLRLIHALLSRLPTGPRRPDSPEPPANESASALATADPSARPAQPDSAGPD